jgi:DNA-binding transcriptional MerR regulator/methylmalonyl-CoA mutase cobalamin-binding subunit
MARSRHRPGPGGLSIGALARATGIPAETLRTWENRYGYPSAARRPSGHRVYDVTTVARLRRIAAALALGHRAGDVVAASDEQLDRLAEAGRADEGGALLPFAPPAAGAPALQGPRLELDSLMVLVRAFDDAGLGRALAADWARLDPITFLDTRIGPLLERVGEAWAHGQLGVRHEHFLSERLEDILRGFRTPFETTARGPLVVCATLPGEHHGLGVDMAALVLASAGARPVVVGTDLPLADLVAVARERGASAVALSVSRASRAPEVRRALKQLARELPAHVVLIVGGAGAYAAPSEARAITRWADLAAWVRTHRLAAGG